MSEDEAEPRARRKTIAARGVFPWISVWLFGDPRSPPAKEAGQTDALLSHGIKLGVAMLVVIAICGLTRANWSASVQFMVWGFLAAFASYLTGIVLGTLFGLPTARGWTRRIAASPLPVGTSDTPAVAPGTSGPESNVATPPADSGVSPTVATSVSTLSEVDIPYDESTSLEQIADWLTKTIVGLTLTQFVVWRPYFEQLARYVSELMMGRGESLIAGGLLITGFSVLGFLTAYLWMRRYFISEMVIARLGALEQFKRDSQAKTEDAAAETAKRVWDARKQAADDRAELLEKKKLEETLRAALAAEQAKTQAVTEAAEQAKARALVEAEAQAARDAAADKARAVANASQTRPEGEPLTPPIDITAYLETAASKMPKNADVGNAIQAIRDAAGGTSPTYPSDPWRERFGGATTVGDFTLSAEVTPVDGNPEWFNVALKVTADSQAQDRVAGKQSAIYFLHQTFGTEPRLIQFGPDGVAPLTLVAYGAFTVGVLLEDGTRLELNLAGVPSAANFPIFLER